METQELFLATQTILASQQITEICTSLVSQFHTLVGADRTTLFLVDHETQAIVYRTGCGNSDDDLAMSYEELTQGLSGLACESCQPILSLHANDGLEPQATRARREHNATGSLIVVPLVVQKQAIGTITAINRSDQPQFTERDLALLGMLATYAAATIEKVQLMERTQRALREMEGLFQAAQAILGSTTLEEVCRNLTAHCKDLVQASNTVIYLVDHERNKIDLSMYDGMLLGDEGTMSYDELNAGISGRVLTSGQPALSLHADDGIEPPATRERRARGGTGALIVVPLATHGRVIGTLTAMNRVDQRVFTFHDVELLMALATQAATTIENVRLLAVMQDQVQRWESISAINELTSAQLDTESLFNLVYEEALHLMGVPAEKATFFIARYDAQSQTLHFDLHYEWGDRIPFCVVPLGDGISSWVIENNRPMLVADLTTEQADYGYHDYLTERERATGKWPRACIAMPLRIQSHVTGVMSIQSTDVGVFDEGHLALLAMWSGKLAIALENARLVEALRAQTTQLQARNEDLDAFAHTVAHDLKNPLSVVRGFAELLREEYDLLDARRRHEALQGILLASEKMHTIIEELLLLAGVRKARVHTAPIDMHRIVNEALLRLTYLIDQHHAQITMPDDWPVAIGYGPWIEEVWANYISNAIKYGGRPPEVILGATEQPDGAIRFWIRDNGPGIPTEKQPRLFSSFERLEHTRADGYGLGLSIVRRIITKLGGDLGVESVPGQGSTFFFTLPKAADVSGMCF
ncbi:MAG: GAF domain-containing protein [Anaerolineae bacterium]|nr:GAF domain-containing protein [Anaerolineae bacterium]